MVMALGKLFWPAWNIFTYTSKYVCSSRPVSLRPLITYV
jgi:hypothetical protein